MKRSNRDINRDSAGVCLSATLENWRLAYRLDWPESLEVVAEWLRNELQGMRRHTRKKPTRTD